MGFFTKILILERQWLQENIIIFQNLSTRLRMLVMERYQQKWYRTVFEKAFLITLSLWKTSFWWGIHFPSSYYYIKRRSDLNDWRKHPALPTVSLLWAPPSTTWMYFQCRFLVWLPTGGKLTLSYVISLFVR